jgi:predicted AAA+ superfamily ATPase
LLNDYTPTTASNNEAFDTLCGLLEKAHTPAETADTLLTYYRRYGYGDIASYRAFRWDKKQKLVGIQHYETMHLADLIGCEHQKEQLVGNTLAFVQGKPANNALLVGARGTGKSSSVKALANEYYNLGLRLLQLTKPQLVELPQIMEALRRFASKKFIIFLDDLSFEEFEVEYKYLKSAIEGGVEARPDNVLIYATSNRRHIIKETWRDREDTQEELYRNDSVNETISLSDRFGLIINYLSPNQQDYLAIIDHALRKKGIRLEPEELRIQGLRWEATHSGRSGRIAQQFVTHYLGQRS